MRIGMRTGSSYTVLLIDNDSKASASLQKCAAEMPVQIFHTTTLAEGIKTNREKNCDIILLRDILPDGTATQAVQSLKSEGHPPEIIIYTTEGDSGQLEFALKNGVWDYVIDPLPEMLLPDLLKRAIRFRNSKITDPSPDPAVRNDFSTHGIIGSSPVINNCLNLATKISQSDTNVLLVGESGTGKELFARAIHNFSGRSKRELVIVDCAALPSTLVESILFGHAKGSFTGADKAKRGLVKRADGGTLFLDEIGEMPLTIQKKLLRVIQERKCRPVGSNIEIKSDFRLIAATNKDIPAMVEDGSFREDLYFRLKTFQIELPPLQTRTSDVTELAYYFRDAFCKSNKLKKKRFSPDFLSMLAQYEWPGNVRELLHAIERSITAAHDSTILYANHLPTSMRIAVIKKKLRKAKRQESTPGTEPQRYESVRYDIKNMPLLQDVRNRAVKTEEKQYLEYLIAHVGNNINKCCAIAGLSRSRFYDLLKIHKISR